MGLTVSMSRGRIAIEHDLRQYIPNNVDENMTQFNRVIIDKLKGKTLAEYTNEYMKPYIDEYNKKQRRSDRKKSYDYAKTYTEEQNNMQASRQNYTAGQLAYEYVIQFGDHRSLDVNDVVKDRNKYYAIVSMFEDFVGQFQEKYPHMKLVLATVHMDEPKGTPHMHILVQPIGEGYKQGLSHQVSLTKALACDGFERVEKKADRLSLTRWQDDVKDGIMEQILKKNYFEREYRDGEKYHMPVAMYKRAAASAEMIVNDAKKNAEDIVEEAKKDADEITIETKNNLFEAKEQLNDLYNKIEERKEAFRKEPARLLETEVGKEIISKEKSNIISRILAKSIESMIFATKSIIFGCLKSFLYEPICKLVERIVHTKGCYINENDKRIIRSAIDDAVDKTIERTGIGKDIEEELRKHGPSTRQLEKTVEEHIKTRIR